MEKDTIYHSVQVNFNDVVIQVSSNHSPLIDHIKEHVRPLISGENSDAPNVSININWRENEPEKRFPLLALAEKPEAVKIGKRLYRLNDTLLWTDIIRVDNMVSLFSLKDEQLTGEYDYYSDIPPKKLEKNPDYRSKKYFSLLKYFLYFPMIWYHEQFKSCYLLHASGVALDGRGVALGGVGGVGKTTTCVGLLRRENTFLLSQNLVFYDDQNYYQLYEPIRLDDNSVDLLADKKDAISLANFPAGTRPKKLFHVQPQYRMNTVPAKLMILPEFAPESAVINASPATALMMLENYNMLTREINDYYWYAATLNLLRPEHFPYQERIRMLEKLLQNIPAYCLQIDRSGGVQPVVDMIAQLAG